MELLAAVPPPATNRRRGRAGWSRPRGDPSSPRAAATVGWLAAASLLARAPPVVDAICSVKAPETGGDPVCLCEDSAGNEWDMTGLGLDQTGPEASSLMATGACSGTYCTGEYEYHLGICANVPDIMTSNGGIGGCSATANVGGFRVDTSTACPPASTCQCEQLAGDFSSAVGPAVSAIDTDDEQGVQLVYSSTAFSPVIVTTVNVICDRSASGMGEAEVVNAPGCTISCVADQPNCQRTVMLRRH